MNIVVGSRCPRCKQVRVLTRHHIYPRCFKWPRNLATATIKLCWPCHEGIHKLIPQRKQMPQKFYSDLINRYVFGLRRNR